MEAQELAQIKKRLEIYGDALGKIVNVEMFDHEPKWIIEWLRRVAGEAICAGDRVLDAALAPTQPQPSAELKERAREWIAAQTFAVNLKLAQQLAEARAQAADLQMLAFQWMRCHDMIAAGVDPATINKPKLPEERKEKS